MCREHRRRPRPLWLAVVIFVVGYAHSGTTFPCEVLHDVGYRFSSPLDHMEDVPLRRLLYDVNEFLLRGNSVEAAGRFHPAIKARLNATGNVQVIKQPALIHCLPVVIAAGFRPKQVVFSHRDLEDVRASLVAYRRYEKRSASTLKHDWMVAEWMKARQFIAEEGILSTVINFPQSVFDRDEIPNAFHVHRDKRQPWYNAWVRRRDPNRVHHNTPDA